MARNGVLRRWPSSKRLFYVNFRAKYGGRTQLYSTQIGRKDSEEPEDNTFKRCEEGILITGISGRFPSSKNMKQFQENLLNGVDMVRSQNRWDTDKLPPRFGFLPDLDKFDAEFFGVIPKLADCMDPQQRKALEVVSEAIIDAGLNPMDLRGTRTGVYVGALGGETTDYNLMNGNSESLKYHAMANPGFMIANRISYFFDLKGTSLHVSTGCSASMIALEQAVNAIRQGTCEMAIVAGSTVHLTPDASEVFMSMNALAPDGVCKAFDDRANGFVRSEAIVVILIQKESTAKRHYATIRHIESNSDGYKSEGIMFPSGAGQEALLRSVYKNAGISPASVSYIEAHGTGTPAGDPQEVQAVYNVFCKDVPRKNPLIIGSVKTNIGHTEYAAGLSSVAKAITCIQHGSIPPNLNFQEHNSTIRHLFGEKLEVANERKEWPGGLIGISSFGLGGTNSHLVLEPGPSKSSAEAPNDTPVFIPFSGRSEKAVRESINEAALLGEKHPEALHLLQHAFRRTIPGHDYRGYGIITPGSKALTLEVELYEQQGKRPLWYVFPGMGSQWNDMGSEMMKFEPFAESINESARILKNIGVDLSEILKPNCSSIFNDIRHALIAITATQVALYDLLVQLEMEPDGFLGHSSGEILCAYADGCLSREETLLVCEARGRAFLEAKPQPGAMASVGLAWEEVIKRCPPEIYAACNNSATNVSVSGPEDAIKDFVKLLKSEGIFAREVDSCGIAPHSKYVGNAPELMAKFMNEICPVPKPRSAKWISSSIPEIEWETHPLAKFSSADYHANNLLQPVLFYEALQNVPSDAVVVEVAPQGYFQGLLKESLPKCSHTAPMSLSAQDKASFFLNSIGKIYTAGVDVNVLKLYSTVSFPVSANTPCLSPLVGWRHDNSWSTSVVTYPKIPGRVATLDLNDTTCSYLEGHRLGNKVVFPATGYLTLAWSGLAESYGKKMDSFPVMFENVSFERATFLNPDSPTALKFSVLDGEGTFVIREDNTTVVKGKIKMAAGPPSASSVDGPKLANVAVLTRSDAYKELRLRGYNYSGAFQGINFISLDGTHAEVSWNGNWTSFLDAILQTTLFSIPTRNTVVPTRLQSLTIHPQTVLQHVSKKDTVHAVPVSFNKSLQAVICPGIEVTGITGMVVSPPRNKGQLVFEKYQFTHFFSNDSTLKDALWKITDIVKNNSPVNKFNVVEICKNPSESVAEVLFEGADKTATVAPKVTLITLKSKEGEIRDEIKSSSVKILAKDSVSDLSEVGPANLVALDDISLIENTISHAQNGAFILVRHKDSAITTSQLKKIASYQVQGTCLELFRKTQEEEVQDIVNIAINSENFNWVPNLQAEMAKTGSSKRRIYVTSQGDPSCGMFGLIKCLRYEEGGESIRGIFDPEGSLQINCIQPSRVLSEIIKNDLAITIYKGGHLGTFCHLPLSEDIEANPSPRKPVKHAFVNTLTTGDLSSLRWIESPFNTYLPPCDNRKTFCKISYASMNFRDVMLASGKLPIDTSSSHQECVMGFEFSGYDTQGTRVMGIVPSKGLATSVLADRDLLFEVPQNWTLEDAATVPVVYCTAYYALFNRGRLSPGQSILIHSGTGGVGLAAISIALAYDCEVFTTVGTKEKRSYIKELFPQLKDENIGNSRDCSFERLILEATKGRGVDVVLNSLAEDKLQASARCLAMHGKFLEIGAFDAFMNTPLGMSAFLKNTEFHGIFLNQIFSKSEQEKELLRQNFTKGIESGTVKPLPRTVFKNDEVEDAFRYMASGKHMGKVLIDVWNKRGESIGQKVGETLKVNAIPKTYFHPEKSYVVIGGLGGLGLEVANWIVDRGAKHLVLPSRSGVTNGYQSLCVKKSEAKGVTVETPRIDLSSFETAEEFIKSLVTDRPIGGMFNSTLVLRDGLIADQTVVDFEAVAAPKILVTKNLDTLTRKYCKDLDYFVTFSSAVSGLGNQAQSNYGYANSVMERICENRRADGLHGLSIQWGVIGDVGFFERSFSDSNGYDKNVLGYKPQSILSCLETLDSALQQPSPVVVSVIMAEKTKKKGISTSGLLTTVAKIFGIRDIEKLSPTTKLSELGMDSLIAAELKQALERDYDFPVTVSQLRSLAIADFKKIETGNASGTEMNLGSKEKRDEVVADMFSMFTLYDDPWVKLNTGTHKDLAPLFIVHGNLGTSDTFKELAARLDCTTYAFQYGRYRDLNSIYELAKAYVRELRLVQGSGPYNICGYSGGGTVAFEVAKILENEYKEKVSNLIFLDGSCDWTAAGSDTKAIIRNILDGSELFSRVSEKEKQNFLDSLTNDFDETIKKFVTYVHHLAPSGDLADLTETLGIYLRYHFRTFSYKPCSGFQGDVTLVRAAANQFFKDETYNLKNHCTGKIRYYTVEGNHSTFLTATHVEKTAKILNEILCEERKECKGLNKLGKT